MELTIKRQKELFKFAVDDIKNWKYTSKGILKYHIEKYSFIYDDNDVLFCKGGFNEECQHIFSKDPGTLYLFFFKKISFLGVLLYVFLNAVVFSILSLLVYFISKYIDFNIFRISTITYIILNILYTIIFYIKNWEIRKKLKKLDKLKYKFENEESIKKKKEDELEYKEFIYKHFKKQERKQKLENL